jgi:hypothetical protein
MKDRFRLSTRFRSSAQADAWEEIVFGSIQNQKLGRAAKAALLTYQESAVCLVFGTGGSMKDGKHEVSHDEKISNIRLHLDPQYARTV